jgi:hypothetical protein
LGRVLALAACAPAQASEVSSYRSRYLGRGASPEHVVRCSGNAEGHSRNERDDHNWIIDERLVLPLASGEGRCRFTREGSLVRSSRAHFSSSKLRDPDAGLDAAQPAVRAP